MISVILVQELSIRPSPTRRSSIFDIHHDSTLDCWNTDEHQNLVDKWKKSIIRLYLLFVCGVRFMQVPLISDGESESSSKCHSRPQKPSRCKSFSATTITLLKGVPSTRPSRCTPLPMLKHVSSLETASVTPSRRAGGIPPSNRGHYPRTGIQCTRTWQYKQSSQQQ